MTEELYSLRNYIIDHSLKKKPKKTKGQKKEKKKNQFFVVDSE